MTKPQPWLAPGERSRRYPEMEHATGRLPDATRARLERALVHALSRNGTMLRALGEVSAEAARELCATGLQRDAALGILASLVEDTGRACGADRPSLLNGVRRWVFVQEKVLDAARAALPELTPPDGAEIAHLPPPSSET